MNLACFLFYRLNVLSLFKNFYELDLFWRQLFNHIFLSKDDGKLSFEEFRAYFSDGVLTGDELKELFHTIDTHNTE